MIKGWITILCLLVTGLPSYCQTINYSYDNLGRLTKVLYPDSSSIDYSYDAAGNRITERVSNICFTKARPLVSSNSSLILCERDSMQLSSTDGVSYLWSTGETTKNIVVKQSGKYYVTAQYSSTCSKTSDTVLVTVRPSPKANIIASGNTVFCSGDSVLLQSEQIADHYAWSNGPVTRSIIVKSGGVYGLKLTGDNGCSDSAKINVTVNPVPTANAGTNQTICFGISVRIGSSAIAGNSYSWSPATGLNNSSSSTPNASPSVTTNYLLTVTNGFGCIAKSQVVVNVNPLPVVNAGAKVAINKGYSIAIGGNPTASGNAPFIYEWSPFDHLSSDKTANPNASPEVTTIYEVTVTDKNGCKNKSADTVTVIPTDKSFFIYPNPTKDNLTIIGARVQNGEWTIRLYDMVGSNIIVRKAEAFNYSLFYTLPVSQLAAGTYQVVFEKMGNAPTILRFVKHN